MLKIHPSYTTYYHNDHLAYPIHPLIDSMKRSSKSKAYSNNQDEIMGRSHSETFASLNDLGVPTLLVHCSSKNGKCMVQSQDSEEIQVYPEDKFEQLVSSMQKKSKKRTSSKAKHRSNKRKTKRT